MTDRDVARRQDAGAPAPMSPEDAMRRMAAATSSTRALRVRTEGLTLVIWAICMAASYLTIVVPIIAGGAGGGPPHDPFGPPDDDGLDANASDPAAGDAADMDGRGHGRRPPFTTEFFGTRGAPLLWYAVALAVTIAIWHSASLSFQTGMSTPRLVAVLAGWMAIFLATTVLLAYVEGDPRSWHLAGWAVVFGLFAALNPLRFTDRSRVVTAVMAGAALLAAAYAFTADLGGRDVGFLSGVAIGGPGLLGGLYLMFRG